MKTLRPYQIEGAREGVEILKKYNILYMAWGVRTGKTATSLDICRRYKARKVLFLTKKKAINSILSDYNDFGYNTDFEIHVCNNESMHKIVDRSTFDLIVHDESHRFGSFPKPSKAARMFKLFFGHRPIIMLSGTPCPESFSQMYHQMWVSDYSPWRMYKTFYRWADNYVDVKHKRIGAFMHNDYSDGDEELIMGDVNHLMLTYTQEEAGFKSKIEEQVLHVSMSGRTISMINTLFKDRVIEGKEEVILADTAAKLMQKVHQLCGGTIKFESGKSMILDTSKADFIASHFADSKIGIFYVFKEELNALKQVYGDSLTTDIDEFNTGKFKSIALQTVSGREGISLKNADYLVFYNIMHSAVSYWQARDRMTTIDRKNNKVFWIFANGGIEDKIYKVVKSKKKYTTNVFKKDYSL